MASTASIAEQNRPYELGAMPEPTRDLAQGLADLKRYGVAIHEGFISDDMADRLRDRIMEQATMERRLGLGRIGGEYGTSSHATNENDGEDLSVTGGSDEPIYQLIDALPNKGRIFIDLFMNPLAHAYADALFAPHAWNLWGQNAIITRKGSREQFLHIDSSILPPEMNIRATSFNCFVCVSDFDPDMGPTSFVPGSHLGEPPRHDGDHERAERFPAAARKGSAIIWDGRTWHGQSEHRSDKTRYAIAMSYCLYAIRPAENYPASIHDAVLETLNEEERDVLGFRTRMTGIMNRFGPRHAGDKHHGIGTPSDFVPELHY